MIIDKIKITNKENEVILLKFDTNHYSIGEASMVLDNLKNQYPDYKFIGLPKDIELEVTTIDNMINFLEELKNENIH